METSLEAGAPIEVVASRATPGAAASAYPAKEVMLSRRRRELLVPFLSFIATGATALMCSKVGFMAGVIVAMVAAVLCLYQCYRVLKAREAPPRPHSPGGARSRLRRCVTITWQLVLVAVTSWACMIGVVRVASYFEANLLERGVCNWGCVRVSLFRSEHCDEFCNPLLLKTDQGSVHKVARRWLEEQPRTSVVRTVEKGGDSPLSKAKQPGGGEGGGEGALSTQGEAAEGEEGGSGSVSSSLDPSAPGPGGATSVTGPTVYTYGLSLSTLIGFPSELGVETSCMALPGGVGNSTGVLVSIQAQQLFRVGFPDIEGEKGKVRELLKVLKDAADAGLLPATSCS